MAFFARTVDVVDEPLPESKETLSSHHLKSEEPSEKPMPTTDSATETLLECADRRGTTSCAPAVWDDPFEDKFPVDVREDRKPAFIRDWSEYPVDPVEIRFSGPTPGFEHTAIGDTPLDYFLYFVTPDFLQKTVSATNRNIERVRKETPEEDLSSVTVGELVRFWGMVLFHCAVLGGVAEWLGDYGLPIGRCMNPNRYNFILRALRFSEEPNVKAFLKYFNDRMRRISNPPKRLVLTDSATVQKDSLVYSRSFVPSGHLGVLYVLTGRDGMVHRLCFQTDTVEPPGEEFSNPIVGSLMKDMLDRGYSVYTGDRYCSVQLVEELLKRKTYCTGTVRSDRIMTPPEIHRATPEQLLVTDRTTHTITSYYTDDGICFAKCDEGREVMCVSSEHGADVVGSDFATCPELLQAYIDMTSSHRAPPMPRLSLEGSNDAKLTLHLLALMTRNAYVHFRSRSSNLSFADFHFDVATHLLAHPFAPSVSPLMKSHLPTLIEDVRYNSVLVPRKMCDSCGDRATATFCKTCPRTPSLCPECYRRQHDPIIILIFTNTNQSSAPKFKG